MIHANKCCTAQNLITWAWSESVGNIQFSLYVTTSVKLMDVLVKVELVTVEEKRRKGRRIQRGEFCGKESCNKGHSGRKNRRRVVLQIITRV